MDCSLPSAPIGKSKTSRTCAMTAVVSSSYFALDFFAFLPPPMPNNASACRCVLFEEKNRLVYCGVFLVSSFNVCFSRRPLLYSFVFLLLFFDLSKNIAEVDYPQKSERSKTSSRAMCDSKSSFFSRRRAK